jgi:hypothetical protein
MKFTNSFCGDVSVFVVLLITIYSGIAIGDNWIEDLYTVKINSVPIRRDVAEGILLRINSDYKRKGINVYNNTQKVNTQLKKIERGMDISIRGSKLLSDLSNLYEGRHEKCRNVHYECMLDNKKFKEEPIRIQIGINDKGVVFYFAAS